jgi:hypothetical protein
VFFTEWEPQHQNRYGNLLLQILNTKFKGDGITEIEDWESKIREYEGTAEDKVAQNIRSATILNGLPRDSALLQHLQLNQDRYSSFALLRQAIAGYHMNRKTWNSTKAAAMDLDALADKSKKKGKEKGKWEKWPQTGVGNGPGKGPDGGGKEKKGAAAKKKGKEKDKEKKTESRECYGCGEKGHLKQNCPNKDKWKVQPTTGTGGADGGTGAKPKDHAALLPPSLLTATPANPGSLPYFATGTAAAAAAGGPGR